MCRSIIIYIIQFFRNLWMVKMGVFICLVVSCQVVVIQWNKVVLWNVGMMKRLKLVGLQVFRQFVSGIMIMNRYSVQCVSLVSRCFSVLFGISDGLILIQCQIRCGIISILMFMFSIQWMFRMGMISLLFGLILNSVGLMLVLGLMNQIM